MTQEELLSVAEIIERLLKRFENQGAEYERKLAEHRASFGARTEADRQIIEGLHVQAQDQRAENERLGKKLAGLNLQMEMQRSVDVTALAAARREGEERAAKVLQSRVQDMREEHGKMCEERDALRAEVARLKSQTTKHPVKVGEWIKRLTPSPMTPAGGVAKVTDVFEVLGLAVKIERPDGIKGTWWAKSCEPCDPPATHDTPEGRSVAESVIRDGRKTEPVAEEIKAGDVIEVVSSTHKLYTEYKDLGRRGVVTAIDGMRVSVGAVPGYELPIRGIVGKCDVRKVTT